MNSLEQFCATCGPGAWLPAGLEDWVQANKCGIYSILVRAVGHLPPADSARTKVSFNWTRYCADLSVYESTQGHGNKLS